MSQIQDLHRQAMDLAEQADLKRLRGDTAQVQELLRQALELEAEAAGMVANDVTAEPTRSVLHRSAAALAVECGEFSLAEKLIARALAGAPPSDIAAELKDLFIQINLRNYLDRQGVTLTEDQLQLLSR
jgi:type II secretory pathway component PulM